MKFFNNFILQLMHKQLQRKCDRLFLSANRQALGLTLTFTDAGVDGESYFGSLTLKPERKIQDGASLVNLIETRLHLMMPSAVRPLDGFGVAPMGETQVQIGQSKLKIPRWFISTKDYLDVRYWPYHPLPNMSGVGPYSIAYGEYNQAKEVFTFFVTLTTYPMPMPPRLHEAHKKISNRIAESFLFNVRDVNI